MNDIRRRRDLTSRFLPRLEALEGRWCPAVNILVIGNTMWVLGDSAANTVTITDEGDGTIDASITNSSGTVSRSADGITRLFVYTRAGNDTVNYDLAAASAKGHSLYFDLGLGDDAATLDATAGVSAGTIAASVFGGYGNDTLDADIGAIASGGAFVMLLDGGFGNDTVTGAFTGELDGALGFNLAGGSGTDTVSGEVNVAEGSTGRLAALVLGGIGNDDLTLNINDESGGTGDSTLTTFRAYLDGGFGTDTCVATDNVKVYRCED